MSIGLTNTDVYHLAVSDTNFYAGTGGGVFLSTDKGNTWTVVNIGAADGYIWVLAAFDQYLFAEIGGVVFFCGAYGMNWVANNTGLGDSYVHALVLSTPKGWPTVVAGTSHGVFTRQFWDIVVSVKAPIGGAPTDFELEQNYPNPFNPSTTISFSLPSQSFVTLKVFDLLGREVASLVSEQLSGGHYRCRWNAAKVPSGVYFYRLQAGSLTQTRKLILLR
jgi:hypothetical protein